MGNAKSAGGRKLVVLSGKTKGTAFVLKTVQVKAGRGSDNAICLKGKRVSLHHAILVRTNGEYTLRAVNARTGTLLNGRRTKEAALKVGDRIRIGEFEMSYEAATARRSRSATAAAPLEEAVSPEAVVAEEQKEFVEELVVENRDGEYEQRLAALTERLGALSEENAAMAGVKAELAQETERLSGEMEAACETLETLRAELQARTELEADLKERLGALSQENTSFFTMNGEMQGRISELEARVAEMDRVKTESLRETERLAGEMRVASEGLEPLRAQLQRQSELQVDLTDQLSTLSQENAGLVKLNNELQAKISELEKAPGEMERVKAELATAQATLRHLTEDMAKACELSKLDANVKPESPAVPYSPARGMEKAEPARVAPVEMNGEPDTMADPVAFIGPMLPVTLENDETRLAAAKTEEEAAAKRGASEQTNQQFDKIRQTIVEKKNQKPKTVLERFLLPFRDTRIS